MFSELKYLKNLNSASEEIHQKDKFGSNFIHLLFNTHTATGLKINIFMTNIYSAGISLGNADISFVRKRKSTMDTVITRKLWNSKTTFRIK